MKWKLALLLFLACILFLPAGGASANTVNASANVLNGVTTPGTPVLTVDSPTQITAVWSTNGNSVSTEYYIENITNSTTSGWTTDNSWVFTNLTCSTSYSFKVKARNSDLVETDFSGISNASTSSCGSAVSSTGSGHGGQAVNIDTLKRPAISNGTSSGNQPIQPKPGELPKFPAPPGNQTDYFIITQGPSVITVKKGNSENPPNAQGQIAPPAQTHTGFFNFKSIFEFISSAVSRTVNYVLAFFKGIFDFLLHRRFLSDFSVV